MQRELCRIAGVLTKTGTKTWLLTFAAAAAVLLPLSALSATPSVLWVSKARGDNSYTGDDIGDTNHPFATIQAAVNKASAGDIIKIEAGIYDEGEIWDGNHTNRVNLTKKVTLEGVEGKDVTHIVGAKDASAANGIGTGAIRPVRLAKAAYGSILKNLTIRDGASRTGSNSAYAYGGGVMVEAAGYYNRVGAYLVDCVVSNCVAEMGGGVYGITAVRCLIAENKSTGWGTGAAYCNLINCLLTGNQCVGTSLRGTVTDCVSVNCTVARNRGSKSRGFDKRVSSGSPTSTPQKMYNCVSFENSNADITSPSYCTISNTYTTATSAELLYDAINGDFRLSPGTAAVGGGRTEFLSLISLPEGISAYKDYAGNDIDPESETCDSGCIQGAVVENEKVVTITAAKGGITVTGAVIGENTIAVGNTITITAGPGTRPCTGVTVNGVTYLFDNTPTVELAITSDLIPRSTISAIYTTDWYVDADAANDNGTGFRPGDPMKTLTNAMAHAVSGDTVHAAAGRYDEGSVVVAASTRARVSVKGGVTLVADEGPEKTFIVGAPADVTIDPYGYGMGTNAIRCAYVAKNGYLTGFTLTGGRTHYASYSSGIAYSQTYSGGAVVGPSSDRAYAYVKDCIISNNYALMGGAARYVNLIRCRVFENTGAYDGGAVYECHAYGSVFNRHRQGTESADSACRNITKFVGCTLGPNNYTLDGKTANRTLNGTSSADGQLHGCLILGSAAKGNYTLKTPISYCVFKGSAGFANTNCMFNAANLKVDDDLRPIAGQNDAVDFWDPDSFAAKYGTVSTVIDLSGEPRVRNGRPDVGALESDPKPWYGKLLDGKGKYVTVTEADNMVTNIANGVTLQDGMAVSLTWSSVADDAIRMGHVRVTGEGTLTLMKDGEPYATYTEADGEVEFSFAATGKSAALVFSFEGEGSADVYSFSSPIGTMLMLR